MCSYLRGKCDNDYEMRGVVEGSTEAPKGEGEGEGEDRMSQYDNKNHSDEKRNDKTSSTDKENEQPTVSETGPQLKKARIENHTKCEAAVAIQSTSKRWLSGNERVYSGKISLHGRKIHT